MMWLVLAGVVLCIALSAYFSAAEMSFSSCNGVRLRNEAEDGDRKSARAVKITERFDDALGAILIGNNLVNIACSSLGSVFILLWLGSDDKSWISTVAVTVAVIIFGETIPKITAKKNANRLARSFSGSLYMLMVLLLPLVRLTVWLVGVLTKGIPGEEPEDADEAVEELQSIIETAEDEEVLDEDRSELVQAAIDFPDISVSEVMTARVDMMAIDIADTKEEILQALGDDPYSRLPVYEESVDHIIGVLHLNRYLRALAKDRNPDLRRLLMPPCYVYKTVKLPAVLELLRKEKQHLAIVTDEYGGTLGVVTMEDVLEQLVGEIWDEGDEVEEEIVERDKGKWELDGDMSVADFCELLDVSEEELEAESETVGGWTVEQFGVFPAPGDSFNWRDYRVTVLEMDERRVEKILLEKTKPAPEETPEPKKEQK